MAMRKALAASGIILCLCLAASCTTSPPKKDSYPSQLPSPSWQASGSGVAAPPPAPGYPAAPPVQAQAQPPLPQAAFPGLSPDEQVFLTNHLARLSYMVYYDEKSGADPRIAKMAVSQANRYLIEKLGLSVIDFDQIEKNKKDQMDAYQAETGGSIDMIQYLAQKFNADVYIEIDFKVSGSGGPGAYTGTAQGSMKLFETSTALLLGSVAFMSPPTFSPASLDAAQSNAVSASIWQAMPKVTEQSKALMAASLSRGLRYELIAQGIPDAKMVAQFSKALSRKFREVEQLSFSPGESRFALFAFMAKSKVQEAIYEAGAAAMMPDMYLVYMRGKSFTFKSGL